MQAKIAHELHKPARKYFPRRRVKVLGIGDLLQADLVEMIPYAKHNNGYLLIYINAEWCLSVAETRSILRLANFQYKPEVQHPAFSEFPLQTGSAASCV